MIAVCSGQATVEEKEFLEEWLKSSVEHERIFRQVGTICQEIGDSGHWKKYKQREPELWRSVLMMKKREERTRRIRLWSYAAVCMLLLGSGGLWYLSHTDPTGVTEQSMYRSAPGKAQAVLELATGEKIALQRGVKRELLLENDVMVRQDSAGELAYVPGVHSLPRTDETYHTLRVPAGGEYHLLLEDGTRVWLNAVSELKFPVRFDTEKREVFLKGEAFFEVAEDAGHPFYICTPEARVKVLGTSFNVAAYSDEQQVEVALVKGKVCFMPQWAEECILQPGQVARFDKESREVSITRENVEAIVAWRSGVFHFENMPLEHLFLRLSRWYQVEFILERPEMADMRFTGAIMKYRDLEYILRVIARTKDLGFVREEGRIRVIGKD